MHRLGGLKLVLEDVSFRQSARWIQFLLLNNSLLGPILPSQFHDADGAAVRKKAEEKKRGKKIKSNGQ
jgi:hypothetical protein